MTLRFDATAKSGYHPTGNLGKPYPLLNGVVMNRKSATSTALFLFCSFILLLSSAQAQIQPHTIWETRQVTVQPLDNLGDINGDGFDDLLGGGQSWYSPGRVDFISGLDGTLLRTIPGILPQGGLGCSVANAGDVNGDGINDALAGACEANRAYLFSGRDGALLYTFIQNPAINGDRYGLGVGGVGDVNGDNVPDVAVGAAYINPTNPINGYFQVFSVPTPALAHLLQPLSTGAGKVWCECYLCRRSRQRWLW